MKQFNIPDFYKSEIIAFIKEQRRALDRQKKDFNPTPICFDNLEIYLARHFGFCYGVENAVEIAYDALANNPDKRIFLLSEMIHNPEVNDDLLSRGLKFIMDTKGNQIIPWDDIHSEDIVIVPAFGTTVEIQDILNKKGIDPYAFNTTCPFVEKVWNRAAQIGERGYTIIVHGKPNHEETRATFSHSKENTPTLVIKDLDQAKVLEKYMRKQEAPSNFYVEFEGQYSEGFDPAKDLERIGVVNQTTMLASETQEISDYLKSVMANHYGLDEQAIVQRFANTRDTLCYATNDNQQATAELLKTPADFAIVVGGYNSSNTSHLVELCELELPTYFVRSADNLLNKNVIEHFDLHAKEIKTSKDYFPEQSKTKILLTCGASCPDLILEGVLLKLIQLSGNKANKIDIINTLKSSPVFS